MHLPCNQIPFLSSELFQDYDAMSKLLNMAKTNATTLVESRAASPQAMEGRQGPTPANMPQPIRLKKGPPKVLEWLSSAPPPKRKKTKEPWDPTQETREVNPNELHIRGYGVSEANGQIPFQPRLSLDQYYYSQLENTAARDKDQVVYRYTNNPQNSTEPKIFMVDQLWMWLINGGMDKPRTIGTTCTDTWILDTLITCAPNQWRHGRSTSSGDERSASNYSEGSLQRGPVIEMYGTLDFPTEFSIRSFDSARDSMRATFKRNHTDPMGASSESTLLEDPLSIHQKVLRHLQQTARKPIASLYDLAGLIVTCCASTFDETQVPDDYQFFDFFENSISIVVSSLCWKAPAGPPYLRNIGLTLNRTRE